MDLKVDVYLVKNLKIVIFPYIDEEHIYYQGRVNLTDEGLYLFHCTHRKTKLEVIEEILKFTRSFCETLNELLDKIDVTK